MTDETARLYATLTPHNRAKLDAFICKLLAEQQHAPPWYREGERHRRKGGERMKCVGGIWYCRGRSYATLCEALAAVWPKALPRRAGEKKSRPRYCEYRERRGERGFEKCLFHP